VESETPDYRPRRGKGIYLLPNLLTTGCLFSGFYAVVAAIDKHFAPAGMAIFAAMIFDTLDGRIARLTRTETFFGKEYDSLADMVAFGVAPGIVAYQWGVVRIAEYGHHWDRFGWLACFFYVAAAALRLARFNARSAVTDKRYFDLDRIVDTLGNVPPELIFASFDMLRPAARIASQIRLWDNMWNDDFVKSYRMFDRWAADQIPFPGECFRQTTKELMWDNKLIKNELVLGGRRVDLKQVVASFLAVMAEHDHIVPYESAKELLTLIGSTDKRDIVLKGGHVSLVAGPNAVRRLWPELDRWLSERSI